MIRPQVVEGFLIPCVVLKNRTQDECYVVNVVSTDSIALLPRKDAQTVYKVGDILWALVKEIQGWKVILTQKGENYVEGILKGIFSLHGRISVHKVSHVANTNFYKVAVKHNSLTDPDEIVQDCIRQVKDFVKYHIKDTITFVPWDQDIERFVINALKPAKQEHIRQIIIRPEGIADVYVEPFAKGIFLGFKGLNAATAAKLTELQIQII